tara:strand:+ start:375 stop:2399 length:2025 start_codon:yes stop_codon:yes gene_type:complete
MGTDNKKSDRIGVEITRQAPDSPELTSLAALMAPASAANVPSGILYWSRFGAGNLAEFDGSPTSPICNQSSFLQFLMDLNASMLVDEQRIPDSRMDALASTASAETVPITLANFLYHSPTDRFAKKVMSALRSDTASGLDVANPDKILSAHRAVFAATLLPTRYVNLTLQPYIHVGLTVSFCLASEHYFSNDSHRPQNIFIDFDDGEAPREVKFDETVTVNYLQGGDRKLTIEFVLADVSYFTTCKLSLQTESTAQDGESLLGGGVGNKPGGGTSSGQVFDGSFDVVAYEGYPDAKGTAYILYGKGNTDKKLKAPLIFADGFGDGSTNIQTFWSLFNKLGLGRGILEAGRDIVLVGYANKSTHIQANAMVMVSVINEVNRRRHASGDPVEPLVIGGASMGGLVARYALAFMEKHGIAHEARTYISYDTPHNGAWVPVSLQYLALVLEDNGSGAKTMSNLLRSPAAQQLLVHRPPAWNVDLEENNELKTSFWSELAKLGNWPKEVKKVGIANGRGDGKKNDLVPGAVLIDWRHCASTAGASCRVQKYGDSETIAEIWKPWIPWEPAKEARHGRYFPKNIKEYDSAPGGQGNFFEQAYEGLLEVSDRMSKPKPKGGCFVPTVSALAFPMTIPLEQDLRELDPALSALDEFIYASESNTEHVEVTVELRDWFLQQIK